MSEAPTRRRRKVADDGSAPSSSSAPVKSSAKNQQYKPDIVEEVKVDSLLFVPDKEEEYVKAKAIAVNGNKVTAVIEETNATADFDIKSVFLRNPSNLDGIEDMARLSYLSEPAVLENLRFRYAQNKIYTYSGLFLVAVNPYKMLPIYTNEIIQKHVGKRRNDIEPHVYTVSDVAYRQMLTNQINQSMLVTGESGAGKTENTKRVIQYLTAIAGANGGGGKLEQQLLQTNPLLEAFGNAKTLRNNNSSRFGKFIDIAFNSSGFITGTRIDHYLLETSRVVFQSKGERNFHFFYQICSSTEAKSRYGLTFAGDYNYLNQSECLKVEGIDDTAEYEETLKSARIIGFSNEEIDNIQSAVAAILHLGNCTFVDDEDEHSTLPNKEPIKLASRLLGVDQERLEKGIMRPVLKAGLEYVEVAASSEAASNNRHSLVKSLYLRLFDWIVSRINQNLVSKEAIKNSIGVLDIAGFEIFENNSFEQLCINFTNEKLQQFFNNHMFKKEQEEYLKEKIEWVFEDFGLDLQPTIDLIEKKGGILDILDNNTFMSAATNEAFALAVIKTHENKPVFIKDRFDQTKFHIKHYAGTVCYTADNWLEKNVDPLNDDCKKALNASTKPFFKALFPIDTTAEAARGSGARFNTVGGNYREQLNLLMNVLRATEPHFIRCIKPNNLQKPGIIQNKPVLEQLKCNGVLEGIRISRKGYPGRIKFADFIRRYEILGDKEKLNQIAEPKLKCKHIMLNNDMEEGPDFQLGQTKVFLRAGREARLEELREAKIAVVIVRAQAACKGAFERKRLGNMLKKIHSAKLIQRNYRAFLQLRDWNWYHLFQRARPMIEQMKKDTAKLSELQEEIEALKDDVLHEQSLVAQKEREKQGILDQIEKYKRMLQENGNKYASLQKDIEGLQADLKKKEGELQALLAEKQNKDGELQHFSIQLEGLRKQIMEKDKEGEEMEEKIKENQETIKMMNMDEEAKTKEIIRSKQEAKDLEDQIKKTKEEIEKELAEQQNIKQIQRSLEERLRETQSKLELEAKARRDKEDKLKELQMTLKQLQLDTNAEKTKNLNLDAEISRTKAEKEAAEDELAEKTKLFDELSRQKKQVDSQIADLTRRFEEEVRNRQAAETKNRHLQGEIAEAKIQIDGLVETQSSLEDEIASLRAEIDELKLKISEMQEQINQLEAKNADLERQLQDTKFSLEAEIKRTKEDLDRINKRYEDAVRDYTEQLEQLAQATEQVDKKYRKTDGEYKKLKRQFEDTQRAKEEAEEKVAKLENDVLNGGQDVDSLRRELNKLETLKREEESAKKDLEVLLTSEKEELARQTLKKANVKREVDDHKERADHLEQEKQTLEDLKAKDDAAVKELEAAIIAERDVNNKTKSELNFNQKNLEELQSRYNQLLDEKNRLENSKRGNDSQLADVLAALEAERASKANLEKKKKNLENELRNLKDELLAVQGKIRDETTDIHNVEQQLRESEIALVAQKNANAEITRALKALQIELNGVKDKLKESEANYNRLLEEKSGLKKSNESLDERKEELNEQIQPLTSQIQHLKEKLAKQQSKIQQEINLKNQLEIDNHRIVSELSKLKDEKLTENNQLKSQLEQLKAQLQTHDNETSRQIKQLKDEKHTLKKQLKHIQRELANKPVDGIDAQAYENLKREFEVELIKLKTKLDEELTARNNAETRKRAIEYQINELKDLIANEDRQRKRLETQKRALALEIDELKEAAEEAEDLREEIANLRAENESQLNSLRGELESERQFRLQSDELEQRLKREAETLKLELQQESAKLLETQRRIEQQYESEISELHQLLNKAKKDKNNVFVSSKRVDRDLRDLNRRLQQESVEKSDYTQKLAQAEREYKLLKNKVDQDTFEMEKAEQDRARLEQTLVREQERIADLEDMLAKLRIQIDSERKKATSLRRRKAAPVRGSVDSDDEY
jgi:myosin protein heavy chain